MVQNLIYFFFSFLFSLMNYLNIRVYAKLDQAVDAGISQYTFSAFINVSNFPAYEMLN